MINRYEPVVNHLAQITGLHPLGLYQQLLQMAGELSTFVSKEKRPPQVPTYLHDDLQKTFSPVISTLRTYLSMVHEQTAIGLRLVDKKYGSRVAAITDRCLLDSERFTLW